MRLLILKMLRQQQILLLPIFPKGQVNAMLKGLCSLNGTSGDEKEVRNFIIENIKNKCDYKVDALGSVIAFKR